MYLPLDKFGKVKKVLIIFPFPEWYYFKNVLSPKRLYNWLNINFALLKDEVYLVGPLFSAPQVALLIEYLISKGLKSLLAIGWAGKSPFCNLELGDLLLPYKAISLEGTSKFYFKRKRIFKINPTLLKKLTYYLQKNSISFKKGIILTVDAPIIVEKNLKEFSYYFKKASAMDMESSALFALSEYYKIKAGALHFITDKIGNSYRSRPEEKLRELRKALISFLKEYIESDEF
ncbi:MAG: hypothetical protein ACK4FM_03120 [Caldimicrobium sp.]